MYIFEHVFQSQVPTCVYVWLASNTPLISVSVHAGTLLCHGSLIKFATGYVDSSSTVLLFSSALTSKVFCPSL